jgi:DNA repair protein RecN (Recombination protein N)
MLCKLSVNNYALIDELNIGFTGGLSIITGETGSGKSILLGALSLILGQRADTSVLLDKSRKCIIEGEFNVSGYRLTDFFNDNELDYDDVTIIRREINESGKSRAFINDTPVNLNLLKELGGRLVDIHSQHNSLALSEHLFQLEVVDEVAGNNSTRGAYAKLFREYTLLAGHFNELTEKSEQAMADLDYCQFQLSQLCDARLVAGEQEELEQELQLLTHAGEIKEMLEFSCSALDRDEKSLLPLLKGIISSLARIKPYFPRIDELHQRTASSLVELRDIYDELSTLESNTDFDPGRAGFVGERLDLLYSLQQKHRVSSVEELIALRDELENRVALINSYEFSIGEAKNKMDEARRQLARVGAELSSTRKAAIPVLEQHMVNQLIQLGIPNARFQVRHQELEDFTREGADRVMFLFSANRQSPPMELARVASGGEKSRVMLGLKSLIARTKSLPTIIFDEIDSGVSGEVAGKMGGIMKSMASNMQVINITHLPQIAGKGDQHFHVYKEDEGRITRTRIKLLTNEERITEIARMLSSDGLTKAAMVNARELMDIRPSAQ